MSAMYNEKYEKSKAGAQGYVYQTGCLCYAGKGTQVDIILATKIRGTSVIDISIPVNFFSTEYNAEKYSIGLCILDWVPLLCWW